MKILFFPKLRIFPFTT